MCAHKHMIHMQKMTVFWSSGFTSANSGDLTFQEITVSLANKNTHTFVHIETQSIMVQQQVKGIVHSKT